MSSSKSFLQLQLGTAPVPPLGVVPERRHKTKLINFSVSFVAKDLSTVLLYFRRFEGYFNRSKNLPDGVSSPHPDPIRNGTVLLQLFGQLGLDTKGFVRRLKTRINIYLSH